MMADDWDNVGSVGNGCTGDEPSTFEEIKAGRSFGKGRGFVPQGVDSTVSDNWGSSGGGSGSGFSDSNHRGGRGGRGWRGDFRERGDRGDRGGRFNNRRNDSDGGGWSNRNENDGGWPSKGNDDEGWGSKHSDGNDDFGGRRDGGGGRGGRGGSRGRDRDFGSDRNNRDDNDNNETGKEKPRAPIYIPTDKTEDELFEDEGVTKGINFNDYKNIKVNITGSEIPPPISSFSEAKLRSLLMDNLRRSHYDEPTPVQKYSIPIIMSGRDLMATAQTGSGKTAAFVLPILHFLLNNSENLDSGGSTCHPSALILSPTRELTIQIYEVAKKFAHGSFLKVNRIYGGTAVRHQSTQISSGCNILIATPGRLSDFLNRGWIDFSNIKFVVLDEADRMLDMGFCSDIENFLNHSTMVKEQRQTLMFSATFSTEIQKMASQYLNDYLFLSVGIVGGACKDVEQNFMQVSKKDKKSALTNLLDEQSSVQGTLLFVGMKRTADFVASYLSSTKYPTTSIHGDRFQNQREEALRDFKTRKMHILVATSVAARGLDIKGVKHVINFDLPTEIDEYVHRIGRTGRLGNQGKATSFYDSETDRGIANGLVRILEQAGQNVPSWLKQDAAGSDEYTGDSFGGYDYRQEESSFKTSASNQPEQIQEEEAW